jgi:undecaprenyl diphosphate synthase
LIPVEVSTRRDLVILSGEHFPLARGPREATGADLREQIRLRGAGEIPVHIAVIMDGNGRWAKQRSLPRIAGHREGVESVRDCVEACGQLGVQYLTLYAFSTENWKRPKDEVSLLMRLLLTALRDETDKLHKNNVRLRTIGDADALPAEVRAELSEAATRTAENTGLTLTLALSYSGRWEITRAVRAIAHDVRNGVVQPDEITEQCITRYLATADTPDPDLLIRTSGELRLSNFLLWQLAYTELYITPGYWPAFRRNDLYAAIDAYQNRERRFGMVSEQVQDPHNQEPPIKRILKSVAGP